VCNSEREIEVLRERLKEYRELLENCYDVLRYDVPPLIVDNLVDKFHAQGIGDDSERVHRPTKKLMDV